MLAQVNKDSGLIASLIALSKRSPKLVRSSVYKAPADERVQVRSWKMNEFNYYDVPMPFPTLARGLFTIEEKTNQDEEDKVMEEGEEEGEKEYRIVARGYNKFFNFGEVAWTTWDSLTRRTAAPYTLSLKSNGCIIFIAAFFCSSP